MEENLFNRLVYMDRNVLDRMTKGEYLGFMDIWGQSKNYPSAAILNKNFYSDSKYALMDWCASYYTELTILSSRHCR